MARNAKWTVEEDTILVQAIQANPQNLSQAFRVVAEKLGRTPEAVSQRWYHDTRLTAYCFTTISPQKKMKNRKIFTSQNEINAPSKTSKSFWKKLKRLFIYE